MILLDTNVVSEPLKPRADLAVLAWIDAQAIETLYLSAITLAELRFGLASMPDGKRKIELGLQLDQRVLPLFRERILPFGNEAADVYGALRARARTTGRTISTADGYIAATAAVHAFAVATRDTQPFEAAGVTVINPWRT